MGGRKSAGLGFKAEGYNVQIGPIVPEEISGFGSIQDVMDGLFR